MNTKSIADTIADTAGNILREARFLPEIVKNDELLQILRYLEDCREEGVSLYPEILVTTDLAACLQTIRPKRIVLCGATSVLDARFKKALKKCAPLAVNGWSVVIEVSKSELSYGIASCGGLASSLTLLEQLRDAARAGEMPPFLFLRRHGNKAIFVTSAESPTVISLTLSHDLLRGEDDRAKFAEVVVGGMESEQRPAARRSVLRVVEQACREGHGILAGVVDLTKNAMGVIQKTFSDGSYLSPVLEFLPPDLQGLPPLAAIEAEMQYALNLSLGCRMLECDLMVLFSTTGQLLGFNIFVPGSEPSGTISGGARTRAFDALTKIPLIKAAFMSSQDGQTYYHEV